MLLFCEQALGIIWFINFLAVLFTQVLMVTISFYCYCKVVLYTIVDLWYPHTANNSSLTRAAVRLSDGYNQFVGRVEVYYSGQWGTVCDDGWDMVDAKYVTAESEQYLHYLCIFCLQCCMSPTWIWWCIQSLHTWTYCRHLCIAHLVEWSTLHWWNPLLGSVWSYWCGKCGRLFSLWRCWRWVQWNNWYTIVWIKKIA